MSERMAIFFPIYSFESGDIKFFLTYSSIREIKTRSSTCFKEKNGDLR